MGNRAVALIVGAAVSFSPGAAGAQGDVSPAPARGEPTYALTVWSAETGASPGDVFAITRGSRRLPVAGHADRPGALRRVPLRDLGRRRRDAGAGPDPGAGRRARRQRLGRRVRRGASAISGRSVRRVSAEAGFDGQRHGPDRGSARVRSGSATGAGSVPVRRRPMGPDRRSRGLQRPRSLQPAPGPVRPHLGGQCQRRVRATATTGSSWWTPR